MVAPCPEDIRIENDMARYLCKYHHSSTEIDGVHKDLAPIPLQRIQMVHIRYHCIVLGMCTKHLIVIVYKLPADDIRSDYRIDVFCYLFLHKIDHHQSIQADMDRILKSPATKNNHRNESINR